MTELERADGPSAASHFSSPTKRWPLLSLQNPDDLCLQPDGPTEHRHDKKGRSGHRGSSCCATLSAWASVAPGHICFCNQTKPSIRGQL